MTEWMEVPNRNGDEVLIKKLPPERTCFVGAPEVFALDQACHMVHEAFGEVCYLVGSSTQKRDFRDVDVRMIFDDAKWTLLFGKHHSGQHVAFWSLTCTAISEWMSRRTGLKVDFQIQRRSSVSQTDWEKPRVPLGLYYGNINPAWRDERNT